MIELGEWTAPVVVENDRFTRRTNEASGISILIRHETGSRPYTVTGPSLSGESDWAIDVFDEVTARRLFLERSLEWLAVRIGDRYELGRPLADYGDRRAGLGVPEDVEPVFEDLEADIEREFTTAEANEIVGRAWRIVGLDARSPFPCATKRAVAGAGDSAWRNEAAGMVVSSHEYSTGTIYDVNATAVEGEREDFSLTTPDRARAQRAYAERWIRKAVSTIGTGFHVDTPASDYVSTDPVTGEVTPGIGEENAALLRQYDRMIDFSHEHLSDPYEVALDAMLLREAKAAEANDLRSAEGMRP